MTWLVFVIGAAGRCLPFARTGTGFRGLADFRARLPDLDVCSGASIVVVVGISASCDVPAPDHSGAATTTSPAIGAGRGREDYDQICEVAIKRCLA